MHRFLLAPALFCALTACGQPTPVMPEDISPEQDDVALIKDEGVDVIVSDGTELPLKFLDVDIAMAQPTEREAGPFPCQPDYFTPSDVPELKGTADRMEAPENVVKIVKGRRVRIDLSVWNEYYTADIAPYQIREYTFTELAPHNNPGCVSYAIDVFKEGRRQALFTHIAHDLTSRKGWQIEAKTKTLLLHNRRVNGARWIEQTRRIELDSGRETAFPLDPCYLYAYPRPDGSLAGIFADYTDFGESGYCDIASDGTLFVKVHPVGVGGSSMGMPYVDEGKRLFVFTDYNGYISKHMQNSMPIVVVNIDDPKQWVILRFDLPQGACDFSRHDLSNFTFDNPTVRVRWREDTQPCIGSGDWITVPSLE